MLHKRSNLWDFHGFVGQDRKILDWRDAAEGCLTPEVQKFRSMHMVSGFSFKFLKLAKLKKTKRIRLNITFRPQIAASSTVGFVV